MRNYRWVVMFFCCVVCFVAYIDRVNMSVAATSIMKDFALSATQMGIIMGAMMPTYLVVSFLSGFIMDRFSPVKTVSAGIFIWSLTTAWFPLTTSFGQMYASRLIFGAGEGLFPVFGGRMVGSWMPPKERGVGTSIQTASALLGVAFGAPICVSIMKAYDWQTLFYTLAVLGFVAMAIVYLMVKDRPSQQKRVSTEERKLIEDAIEEERVQKGNLGGVIIQLLKNPYLWLVALSYVAVAAIWFANLTWLPGYMAKEKGFTVFKSGMLSAFPFFMGAVGAVSAGYITDKFLKGHRLSYILFAQLLGPVLVFFAIGATGTASMIILFSVSMFFTAGAFSMHWAVPVGLFSNKVVLLRGCLRRCSWDECMIQHIRFTGVLERLP